MRFHLHVIVFIFSLIISNVALSQSSATIENVRLLAKHQNRLQVTSKAADTLKSPSNYSLNNDSVNYMAFIILDTIITTDTLYLNLTGGSKSSNISKFKFKIDQGNYPSGIVYKRNKNVVQIDFGRHVKMPNMKCEVWISGQQGRKSKVKSCKLK